MRRNNPVPMYQENHGYNATLSPEIAGASQGAFGTAPIAEVERLNRNVAGIGKQLADYTIRMQKQKDDNAIVAADNEIQKRLSEYMYNPETGIMMNKGKNADGMTIGYDEEVDKIIGDVSKDFSPYMKRKLGERITPGITNKRNNVARHEGGELRSSMLQDIEAGINAKVDNAIQDLNQESVDLLKDDMTTYVADRMHFLGEGEEAARSVAKKKYGAALLTVASEKANNGDVAGIMEIQGYAKGLTDAATRKKLAEIMETARKVDIYNRNYETSKKLAQAYKNNVLGARAEIRGMDLQKAAAPFLGQRMPNGANGCVEAVVRIGQSYSDFLKDNIDETNVSNLVNKAKEAGIEIENGLNLNTLKAGDILVYGDENHVVIYDGKGGAIGNSTSDEKVKTYSDFGVMGEVTKVIHTGNDILGLDPKERASLENMTQAEINSNETLEKKERAEYLQDLTDKMADAGNYSEAVAMLEAADLTPQEKNKLTRTMKTYYGVTANGKGKTTEGYTPKAQQADINSFNAFILKLDQPLDNGISIGANEWLKITAAAKRLRDSGSLPDGMEEEITAITGNTGFYSELTDTLEKKGYQGAYKDMLDAGAPPIVAAIIITQIHNRYKTVGKTWSDEEKTDETR